MGSTRGGVKASAQRAHARWQQNEGFNNHIDLLPPWLAWCTPRGARTRTIPSHTFTHTHTHNRPSVECFKPCAWQKSAAAAAAAAFATVPSPRVSP